MKIVLVRIYVYSFDESDREAFTAFRDMASAEEWLKAGNFQRDANGRWGNRDVNAECIEMEVV